jgi:acetyl esterase/lipase
LPREPRRHEEKVAKANPITHVTKNAPPFLICHGDADPLVPHHQSELLEAALKQAGVPVTLYTVKGAGLGGFRDPKVPELTREFLARCFEPDRVHGMKFLEAVKEIFPPSGNPR